MASEIFVELIDEAVHQAGSLVDLARALSWPHSNILRSRREKSLSPYRAAQLAEFVGYNPRLGAMMALREGAKTDAERSYWDKLFQSDLMTFELLNLSRIERHAETKAQSAGADAKKYRDAAQKARAAIAEAVKAGAKLPPAMDGKY